MSYNKTTSVALILLLVSLTGRVYAQSLTGSSGQTFTANGLTLSFAVGEASAQSHSTTNFTLNEGMLASLTAVEQVLGIKNEKLQQITTYPNPASDWVSIQSTDVSVDRALIYDINGQKVLESPVLEGRLEVSRLPDGIYTILFMNSQSTNSIVARSILKVLN